MTHAVPRMGSTSRQSIADEVRLTTLKLNIVMKQVDWCVLAYRFHRYNRRMWCHDHTCSGHGTCPHPTACGSAVDVHTLPHLAVTNPCCLSRPSGCSADGVLIQLSRFWARGEEPVVRVLTVTGERRFVKWGVPLWLVSRSAPLSGLLKTRDERRCVRCRSGPPLVCTLYSSSEAACQGVDRSAFLMGRQWLVRVEALISSGWSFETLLTLNRESRVTQHSKKSMGLR